VSAGVFGDFRRYEVALALAAAFALQAGAIFALRAVNLDRKAEAPEIDKGPSVPVKVVPVLDLDAPSLKLGGKRDRMKLPDRWIKPKPKPRVEEKAFVSTKAEQTEEAIPPKEIEVAKSETPVPPPEAEVAKAVETPIEAQPKEEPPPNSSSSRPASSSCRTTETDPLKARAVIPGSSFSCWTASTRSPCSCSELRQLSSRGLRDATILRMSPSRLANSASSPPAVSRSGHAPAKLS